jgi:hypothetical protein
MVDRFLQRRARAREQGLTKYVDITSQQLGIDAYRFGIGQQRGLGAGGQ